MVNWRRELRPKRIKRRIRRPFEWLGIFLAMGLFAILPRRMMLFLSDIIGAIGYACDRRGRELSLSNLRIMLGKELTPKREKIIIRRSYRNMARTLGHIFWTSCFAKRRAAAAGELSPETLKWLSVNRPAVTVSGHIGNWEILSQLVCLQGHRIVSVAKNIGTPAMTSLLMKARRSIGQDIVPASGAFQHLLKNLKNGADVGLLVDQYVKPKHGGIWVRFFGEPICVSVAPAFLALKTNLPVIVAWSRPLKNGRYICEVIKTYEARRRADIREFTTDILKALESTIRRHPSAWVLNYRYWTVKPTQEELAALDALEASKKESSK